MRIAGKVALVTGAARGIGKAAASLRVAARVGEHAIPQSLLDRHLLGLMQPAQIARVALFLASEASSAVTGQIVTVDGGATIT